jgi:dimethylaniline monooxygenase (N-oxide forming)
MHNIDEIGLNISKATRAAQWLLPVRPASYRKAAIRLAKRLDAQEAINRENVSS